MIKSQRPHSADAFARTPLPKRFCNLDRLLHAMKTRALDALVATTPWNVFYLTGFNAIAHKSDEPIMLDDTRLDELERELGLPVRALDFEGFARMVAGD